MNLHHDIPPGEERMHIREIFCECQPISDDLTIVHQAMRETGDGLFF